MNGPPWNRTKSPPAEMAPITGRVKWFDATRGFGFLVSDALEGDVLLHFSVLREHGRRSVPEGAVIECVPVRLSAGFRPSGSCRSTFTRPCPSRRARPFRSPNGRTAGPCRGGRRVRAGGGQMVQSRSRLWFREAAGRGRRRGRVRAHGDGAQRPAPELQPGKAAGADRVERQGPDRGRAQVLRRVGTSRRRGDLRCMQSPGARPKSADR